MFKGLDKLTNGIIDNQEVRLPKNKEQELRTRTTKRKKEKVAAVVVVFFVWFSLHIVIIIDRIK